MSDKQWAGQNSKCTWKYLLRHWPKYTWPRTLPLTMSHFTRSKVNLLIISVKYRFYISLWIKIRIVVKLQPSVVFLSECIFCDTDFLFKKFLFLFLLSSFNLLKGGGKMLISFTFNHALYENFWIKYYIYKIDENSCTIAFSNNFFHKFWCEFIIIKTQLFAPNVYLIFFLILSTHSSFETTNIYIIRKIINQINNSKARRQMFQLASDYSFTHTNFLH